jgi:hypothetical protein
MPDTPRFRISELPPADALTGAELVPVVQGGNTRRTTRAALAPVASVNGGTGAVVLDAEDVGAAAADHDHIIADVTGLQAALDGKQASLVSGTNIKTVNGVSLLGSGDIDIEGGAGSVAWGGIGGTLADQTDLQTALNGKAGTATATTSAAGLMSAGDKTKLDGVATGATANAGTVTSVNLTAGGGIAVSGGPVTASGAITVALADMPARTVIARPGGTTGAPENVALGSNTILGRQTGDIIGLSAAQARTILNVADGATANAADAALRDRTTHTGAQAISTITGLQAALDARVIRVVHGSTASTARPAGADFVEWVGTVAPTNAAENDTWVNPA